MKSMVVLFALCAVACGSYVAQPPHHPAIVLDPHGRPLDTAEVINSRALHLQAKAFEGHYGHAAVVAPYAHSVAVAPAVVAAPAAISHQSRVDVRHSPAIVSHSVVAPAYAHAAPLYAPASPLLAHSALGYAGHYLHKRSLGHYAYSAPAVIAAPSAVSHQSRVDVISSPAVVSHAVAAPVLAHAAPVVAHAAPVVAVAPAAVSHQSRVDVHSGHAVVAHAAVAPLAHAHHVAPLAHAAVVPVAHHGVLANINHAAVAPIGYANHYNYGHGYHHSAPLVHAW